VPTIHVNWVTRKRPEIRQEVAHAIAESIGTVKGAEASSEGVLVYFDDLTEGDLYVDGVQLTAHSVDE
jgi:phenylpyruvate tautomerase PptA (4-oxalocrotonate tautomerase family)